MIKLAQPGLHPCSPLSSLFQGQAFFRSDLELGRKTQVGHLVPVNSLVEGVALPLFIELHACLMIQAYLVLISLCPLLLLLVRGLIPLQLLAEV